MMITELFNFDVVSGYKRQARDRVTLLPNLAMASVLATVPCCARCALT
jgi:hypothetical protein